MDYKQMVSNRLKKMANKINMKNEKYAQRIQEIKDIVKKEDEYVEKCKEYDKSLDFIENVKISFEQLDVSAKTVNGEIYLNEKLYTRPMDEQVRYVIHELVHCFQQDAGLVEPKKTDDYLDDENEQEAFQVQLEYMDKHTPE